MPKNSKNLIDAADDTDSFRSTTSESESSRGKNNKNNEPKDVEEQPIPCLKQSPDGQSHWSILPVGLAMGAVFGFALQKGEVYLPMRIANQFTLRDFTMLKMFLSASVTSSLVFSVGYLLVPDHFKAMRSSCSGERKTLKETATGAGLLGVGMAVAGSCPGNVLVQIGSGLVPAFLIFACGLFGAFLYGILEGHGIPKKIFGRLPDKTCFVDQHTKQNYLKLIIPLSILLIVVIALVEYFFPYYVPPRSGTVFEYTSWSPILAGVIVGLLQFPGLLFVKRSIGSSSAYVAIVAQPFRLIPSFLDRYPYLKKASSGIDNMWQPLYLVGAVGGAMLSAGLSGRLAWRTSTDDKLGALPLGFCAIGGFLMVFGSRMGGGCTSGHGLSGFAHLSLNSLIATCVMFGTGIITGLILYYADVYPPFIYGSLKF